MAPECSCRLQVCNYNPHRRLRLRLAGPWVASAVRHPSSLPQGQDRHQGDKGGLTRGHRGQEESRPKTPGLLIRSRTPSGVYFLSSPRSFYTFFLSLTRRITDCPAQHTPPAGQPDAQRCLRPQLDTRRPTPAPAAPEPHSRLSADTHRTDRHQPIEIGQFPGGGGPGGGLGGRQQHRRLWRQRQHFMQPSRGGGSGGRHGGPP